MVEVPAAAVETRCDGVDAGVEPMSTLMFRYMPRKFTFHDLMAELVQRVSSEVIDFVYVPWDSNSKNNLGYGFANFTDPAVALRVKGEMEGKIWQKDTRQRSIVIVAARLQGLQSNLQRFYDSNTEPDSIHCPQVFCSGQPVPLQTAIKMYCRRSDGEGQEQAVLLPPSDCTAPDTPQGISRTATPVSRTGSLSSSPVLEPAYVVLGSGVRVGSETWFEDSLNSPICSPLSSRHPQRISPASATTPACFSRRTRAFGPPPGLDLNKTGMEEQAVFDSPSDVSSENSSRAAAAAPLRFLIAV